MITTIDPVPFTWTRQEYEQLAETGVFGQRRVELIEGQVLQMNPMGSRHVVTLMLLARLFPKIFDERFALQYQLPLAISQDSMPEPDAAIVSGDPRDYRDGIAEKAHLVIEVSDTTLRFDRITKARIYANAQIEEYWIINLSAEQIEIHRQPLFGSGYAEKTIAKRGEKLAPLCDPDALISVDDMLP
jgi:Uma2 family endonuclease